MTNSGNPQEGNVTKDDPPSYASSVAVPNATHEPGQRVYQQPTVSNAQTPPYIEIPPPAASAPAASDVENPLFVQSPQSYHQEPRVQYVVHNTVLPTHISINSIIPISTYCSYCNNHILTRVIEVPGSTTYCFTAVLCCLFWPLAWLPFFMSSCLDKIHQCPVCNSIIGVVRV